MTENTLTAPTVMEKYKGKTFFFSGKFSYEVPRRAMPYVQALGGILTKQVDANVDYLVLGKGSTADRDLAKKLNKAGAKIAIVTDDDLPEFFKPTDEEALQLLRSGREGALAYTQICMLLNRKFNCNLEGADLSGLSLSDVHFYNVNINRADFTGSRLSDLWLNSITDVCFKRAHIAADRVTQIRVTLAERCDFREVKMHGKIQQLDATDCDFSNSIISGAIWVLPPTFNNCRFVNAQMRVAMLRLGKFAGCDLSGADLTDADLMGSDFSGSNLSNANLTGANLLMVNFSNCNLTGANLQNAVINGANLSNAIIKETDFEGASTLNVNWSNVDGAPGQIDSHQPESSQTSAEAYQQLAQIERDCKAARFMLVANLNSHVIGICVIQHEGNFHLSIGESTYADYTIGRFPCLAEAVRNVAKNFPVCCIDVSTIRAMNDHQPDDDQFRELLTPVLCRAFGITSPSTEQMKEFDQARSARYRAMMLDLLRGGPEKAKKFSRTLLRELVGDTTSLDLSNVEISGADLAITMKKAKFDSSTLHAVDFGYGEKNKISFKNCTMSECTLDDNNLSDADFSDCNLKDIEFERAKLTGSKFTGATLENCNFIAAVLNKADFSTATLKNCQWKEAQFNELTKFPDDFDLPVDMVWTGKGVSPLLVKMQAQAMSQGPISFDELLVRIREHIDADRVKNALKMLKAESFRLYTDLTDDSLVGVVKSQTDLDLVYSCRLTSGGIYSCCTQNLNTCGGLRNGACKHLLVLLIGLTKGGELSPTTADLWMQASFRQKPQLDKEMMTSTFLRFKGAEAGEIDWRPTETIPEDYYSM